LWTLLPWTSRAELPAVSQAFADFMKAHHYWVMELQAAELIQNAQTVNARVNGSSVSLLVDTGCSSTTLNPSCARRLKLDVRPQGGIFYALGGRVRDVQGLAYMQDFTLHGCAINRTNTIHVFSQDAFLGRMDGLLGLDFLRLNAAVYPVGGSGFLLKPGPTPAVSIAPYMQQLGYKGVPLRADGGGLTVSAHVSGQAVLALVDTGASFSIFHRSLVEKLLGHSLGYTPIQLEGVDHSLSEDYHFTPSQLDLGGVPFPAGMTIATNTGIFAAGKVDLVVGYDLLAAHRAIIDCGGLMLYFK
jgi:hypothetical protein